MASPAEAGLFESGIDPDPLVQFRLWFEEASAAGAPLPEAMALATASRDGTPSARMVLCKGADARGFTFFTNYGSDKGRELEANPRAALVFYWSGLGRQVRVTGTVTRISGEESDAYFDSRPYESRLSAAASPQSAQVPDRAALEALIASVRQREGEDLRRPDFWGGYRLEPSSIEFWLHRDNRLHDRLRYRRAPNGSWLIERLAP